MKPETPVKDKSTKVGWLRTASRISALFSISLLIAGVSALAQTQSPEIAGTIGASMIVAGILLYRFVNGEKR